MDCKVATANHWSKIAIGAAIEVHRLKGAGLLESIYEKCLARELELREVPTVRQFQIRFEYKGITFAEFLRLVCRLAYNGDVVAFKMGRRQGARRAHPAPFYAPADLLLLKQRWTASGHNCSNLHVSLEVSSDPGWTTF